MRLVGLTGGIASGKSTTSKLLRREGITVLDCDEIAHAVVRKGRWGWRRVVKEFGQEVLLPDGELDRKKLGQIVFDDASKRKVLNRATHIPVYAELLRQILWSWLLCKWLVVVDMPLLFETGSNKWLKPCVLVYTDQGTQVRRLIARNQLTPEEALKRVNAQMAMDDKLARADEVVDNNGGQEELEKQVVALATRLKSGAQWPGLLWSPVTVGGVLLVLAATLLRGG
uniref:Dephospho-CoA kinase n=1 Tax=Chlamydomonas leiostraca TaxID=1034604 RepID=A0A7S0S4B0_9CHLO|mmetsp:Transcript_7573/g.18801  ORF Transcript_7573/g.18801 Transcript_7573/m.18801 type:complete len:227 (+) Transcript_7573:81-761(+)|eukprot:CAMPEP_0202865558 /NCGR_PEP_ID=MMETSP1391-20130828/6229_1 /ASSEMBLY_ACC=CAM_ASM_000867 /TAXON_ID=1034604 /ORGANISM="Chlamydomonas leiostraca, Strain SAG 11-49" /LENGTH=226 /DNA_ID=CAMNT_0049545417 /DNA_START=81 /DNA_END=761 /DNA_ORIENTATION=-